MVGYEEFKKYVEDYYGYTGESDETNIVAKSIYNNYDKNKVKYAVKHIIDLYDLDRWEAISNLNDSGNLQERLKEEGYEYSQKDIDSYIKEFDKFVKNLVDPLYEDGYEIMELI